MSLAVAAAPVTMDDLPHEVLAYVLLHVRGPPASGALRAARDVSRRWREVIDAHLKLVAPCKLYVRAFQLGYLSPRGLLSVPDNSFAEWLRETLHGAARARDGNLFLWCGDLIEDKRLTTQEQVSLQASFNDTEKRVQCGIWEGLTHEELQKVVYYIHPADMMRARSGGIRFEPYHMKHMLANGQVEDFSGWSNDDIRAALRGGFSYTLTRLLDFFLRRGIVDETTIDSWLATTIEPGKGSDTYERASRQACANQVLNIIETRGWQRNMTTRTYAYTIAWYDWALIQRVVLMCLPVARQAISWQLITTTFDNESQLNWFYSLGFFNDIAVDAANKFFLSVRGSDDKEYSEHARRMFTWYLDHLPQPTSTKLMMQIVAPSTSTCKRYITLLPVVLQHHIPWDPILTYFANRGVVRELFKAGYRLPTDVDMYPQPYTDAYYAGWSKLIAMAAEFGQPPTMLSFRPVFLAEAAKRARGRDLLVQLAHAGVVLPEELRGVVEGRAE